VNHERDGSSCFDDDELTKVAGSIRADDEVARRVVTQLDPDDRLLVGVFDVGVRNSMTASCVMDLHTQ